MKDILSKIQTIIQNDKVRQYFITTSKIFSTARRNLIDIQGFTDCEILKENLSPREALILKKNLFEYMQQNRSTIFYKKYHNEKRDGRFYPSLGGIDINSDEKVTLGIAWF
jgi:hypothetical protein